MSRQQLRHQIIGSTLVILFLIGCGAPAAINPQPSVILTGELESSEGRGSGTITFKVSDDGNSIGEGEVKLAGQPLKPVKCEGGSLEGIGELTQKLAGPFPVKEGNIDISLSKGGELKGKFTSPNEANGTIKIVVDLTVFNTIICDFGMWNWDAKAK